MQAVALEIARGYLGRAALRSERLSNGVMNYMFRILSERESLCVVRIYPPGREKVAQYEPALLQHLRQIGCQVPEVIGFKTGSAGELPCHLVYRYIEGSTLEERREQLGDRKLEALAYGLIENLARMALCVVNGYGGLITSDRADEASAWAFVSRSISRGMQSGAATGVLEPDVARRMEALLSFAGPEVSQFDGALGWGDLALSNVLVDAEGKLAGLVDFESTFALDRALSIGYLYALSPEDPLVPMLMRAARAMGFQIEDRRAKLCAVLRAARMSRFAHRSLPSGVAQRPIAAILPGALRALWELTEH